MSGADSSFVTARDQGQPTNSVFCQFAKTTVNMFSTSDGTGNWSIRLHAVDKTSRNTDPAWVLLPLDHRLEGLKFVNCGDLLF